MRHTLVKLMGLLLALTLVLTGCNLIAIDPIMQLDEDTAKLTKDFATVVAEYDGGKVTKGDVMGTFASNYSYYAQMYSYFGMSMTADVVETVKEQTLEHEIQAIAMKKEMENRGLTLTEEELNTVQEEADKNYQDAYDSYAAQVTEKDEKVKARQTEYNMYQNGLTQEMFYKSQLHEAEEAKLEEAVKGEIAELTDEELQAAYDEKVAADQSAYEGNAGDFESAMASDDETVAWMPEGYRTVKHILVKPESDVLQAVTDARNTLSDAQEKADVYQAELDNLNDGEEAPAEETETAEAGETEAAETEETESAEAEEAETEETDAAEDAEPARTREEIQADLNAAKAEVETAQKGVDEAVAACLESVKEKTDEIYAKLADGAEFADLIAEYGEDPGMQNEPTATRGYYVSADSENWDKNFTAGAMALENVGDVSETPVISTSGVHIIRYESDVTAGAVPLEDIRDTLYETTLTTRKDEHYDEALNSWVEALNPVYHLDAFTLN